MSLKTGDIGIFIIITTLLILLLIGFIILILFLYKKHQLNAYKTLEILKNDYEKNLLASRVEMQEQTFKHISKEVHDNIGLALTLAKLHLNTIQWINIPAAATKVTESVNQLTKAIEDLRHLARTLDFEFIAENGLTEALAVEIEHIKKLEVFEVHYELSGYPVNMKTQDEIMIFRIVQEAMNNSIKHSHASRLSVKVQYFPSQLYIEVSDNGTGWKTKNPNTRGLGIKNMRQRAGLLNGTCMIESNDRDKTTVSLIIPVESKQ